jgi:hypothetical protein
MTAGHDRYVVLNGDNDIAINARPGANDDTSTKHPQASAAHSHSINIPSTLQSGGSSGPLVWEATSRCLPNKIRAMTTDPIFPLRVNQLLQWLP